MDLLARAPATGNKFDSPIGHGCLNEVAISHLTQPRCHIFRELQGVFNYAFVILPGWKEVPDHQLPKNQQWTCSFPIQEFDYIWRTEIQKFIVPLCTNAQRQTSNPKKEPITHQNLSFDLTAPLASMGNIDLIVTLTRMGQRKTRGSSSWQMVQEQEPISRLYVRSVMFPH